MELIDKDALLSRLNDPKGLILLDGRAALVSNEWGCLMRYGDVVTAVESSPTIDAEPMVRCGECVHCLWDELHKDKKGRCMEHHIWCEADGFCHKGEKMDGGAE